MKQNRLPIILSTLALLGGLGSCKKNDPSNASSAVNIRFWVTFGQEIQSQVNDEIDKFKALVKENEHVDVDIQLEYQGDYNAIYDKMTKAASIYDLPTIAVAYPDHVATYLGYERSAADYGKYVYDLSRFASDPQIGFGKEEYLGDKEQSDFIKAFLDEGTSYLREGMYSLPLMKSTEVMIYNKEAALSFARLKDPAINSDEKVKAYLESLSWDEFMDFCQFILDHKSESSFNLKQLKWPAFYDSDSNLFVTSSIQKKIPYLSIQAGKGSNDFNNAQAKQNVTKLKGYHDRGLFSTKGSAEGKYGSTYFKNGETIFDIGSTGGAGYNLPTGNAFEAGICKVPSFNKEDQRQVNQGVTVTLTKAKDDKDGRKAKYAWKFLKYITNATENALLCTRGSQGYMPVRHSAFETRAIKAFMGMEGTNGELYTLCRNLSLNDSFYTTPSFMGAAKSYEAVGGIMTQVFTGKKSVDEAFTEAYAQAQQAQR